MSGEARCYEPATLVRHVRRAGSGERVRPRAAGAALRLRGSRAPALVREAAMAIGVVRHVISPQPNHSTLKHRLSGFIPGVLCASTTPFALVCGLRGAIPGGQFSAGYRPTAYRGHRVGTRERDP